MKDIIKIPNLLLPNEEIDMTKWATIACDQYTSEASYWQDVEDIVKGYPSSYYLMLPEIYLEEDDLDKRIDKINKSMDSYIGDGTLKERKKTAVIIERSFDENPTRTGILLAIDLEAYDFRAGSKSLIRATEGTVEDRLPPRMKIREKASLEMPHILVLIDDPKETVIEPVRDKAKEDNKPIYDFSLMKNGGRIKGYPVDDQDLLDKMEKALNSLIEKDHYSNKYGVEGDKPLLFAVGDGNHSLASAKCHWDKIKENLSKEEKEKHPARYALCEIINIHDKGIVFEPIHRVLFDVNENLFFDEIQGFFGEKLSIVISNSGENIGAANRAHAISFVTREQKGTIYIDKEVHTLAQGALQAFLDYYTNGHPETKIDYIHGMDSLLALSQKENNMGFILENLDKYDFFTSIIKNGPMPRKTFSLGEADEKRFYLEARKIK